MGYTSIFGAVKPRLEALRSRVSRYNPSDYNASLWIVLKSPRAPDDNDATGSYCNMENDFAMP